MGTLALYAAGNALLPGLGGVLGGLAGSIFDNRILFPALFPLKDQQGPRLGDLQLTTASEGSPLFYCLGPENVVGGTIIWAPKAIEIVTEEHAGKGSGPVTTNYTYFQDLAITVCDHQVSAIKKIWANGTLIYSDTPNLDITSTQISAVSVPVYQVTYVGEEPVTTLTGYYLDIFSPNLGPDLTAIQPGIPLVMSGWTSPATANNGTWEVWSTSRNSGTGVTTARLVQHNQVVPVTKSAGNTIVLHQDLPSIASGVLDDITFYLGTTSQTADALMESYDGPGNVPAYRSQAYVVINRLALTPLGNRLPTFKLLVEEATTRTIGEAIQIIYARSGRPITDIDVTGVTGNIRGYTYSGITDTLSALAPILFCFDLLAQEKDSVLYFFSRSSAVSTTINIDELAAHLYGDDAPRRVQFTDINNRAIPTQVNVSYLDSLNDYQNGSQSFVKASYTNLVITEINTQIVMSASDAQLIARRTLWTAWANRQNAKVQLPPSKMAIIENDIINAPDQGDTFPILVGQADIGANFLLTYEGVVERSNTLSFDPPGAEDPTTGLDSGGDGTGTIYIPSSMLLNILDIGPLQEEQVDIPGFYAGTCIADIDKLFAGANFFESIDGGTNYNLLQYITQECTMGFTTSALGGSSIKPFYWDIQSTVTVVLNQGTLSSVTQTEVLNGSNRALIGGEMIGFASAVLTAPNTYLLSTLLRGLRDTEAAIGLHNTTEPFILLNSVGLGFKQIALSSINTTRYYKVVPTGGVPASFDPQVIVTLKANTLRPFGPCQVRGDRNTGVANDLLINWTRRTRSPYRILSGVIAPLNDPNSVEQYQIDFLNPLETAVVRTVTITALTTYTYTAANQSTDGLSPGAAVHGRIYQVSSLVGRGKPEKFIL